MFSKRKHYKPECKAKVGLEALKGEIGVKSACGEGTTFTIELPIQQVRTATPGERP